jgi:protein-arginine kinase activator protein McsA
MDTQIIRKQLLSISAIVKTMLAELDDSKQSAPKQAKQKRSVCPVCDLDFTGDDPDNGRGVHSRCYKRLQRESKLQESEEAGVLLPKQKVGRKRLIDVDAIIDKTKNLSKKSGRNSKDS